MDNIESRLKAIRGLEPLPEKERASYNITDIKKGGYMELDGETWKVINVFMYLDVKWSNFKPRKNDYWITELELFSLNTGETIYVEWELDDKLEICRTDALVKMRDIQFEGKSLKSSDLEYIADEEEGDVQVNGVRYSYSEDDTWAGLFFKGRGEKTGVPMRAYEFESSAGKFLTVETWHEDDDERPDREAFLSHSVRGENIAILQIEESGR